jgi:PST family polysaccharide transporter
MNLNRKVTIGGAWSAAGTWGEQGGAFVIFVILAKLLSPHDFGLAGMALLGIILAEVLIRETVTDALIQRHEIEAGHRDAVFAVVMAVACGMIGLLFAGSGLIARLFEEPAVADLVRWSCPVLLLTGASAVPAALIRRQLRMHVIATRAVGGVVAGGIVGITLAFLDFGAWSLVGQRVGQMAVGAILILAAGGWRPGLAARRRHFRDVGGFASAMFGVRLVNLYRLMLPNFLIGYFLGATPLGYYTLAQRIVEVLFILIVGPLRLVALPALSQVQRNLDAAREMMRSIITTSTLALFACFCGLIVVAPEMVTVSFGPQWAPSILVLQILGVANIQRSVDMLTGALMQAMGRAGWSLGLAAVDAAILTVALLIAGPFGMIAMAWALAAQTFATWPIRLYVLDRLMRINFLAILLRVFPVFAAALTMAAAVYVWRMEMLDVLSPLVLLATSVALGVIVYLTLVLLLLRPLLWQLFDVLWGTGDDVEAPVAHAGQAEQLRSGP